MIIRKLKNILQHFQQTVAYFGNKMKRRAVIPANLKFLCMISSAIIVNSHNSDKTVSLHFSYVVLIRTFGSPRPCLLTTK